MCRCYTQISIYVGGFVSDWWVSRIKSSTFSFPVGIQVQPANQKKINLKVEFTSTEAVFLSEVRILPILTTKSQMY